MNLPKVVEGRIITHRGRRVWPEAFAGHKLVHFSDEAWLVKDWTSGGVAWVWRSELLEPVHAEALLENKARSVGSYTVPCDGLCGVIGRLGTEVKLRAGGDALCQLCAARLMGPAALEA